LALLVLLQAGCQQVYFQALNRGNRDAAVESVTYQPATGLALDIHRPAPSIAQPSRGAAVVVFFHGGSWRDGRRQDYRFVGDALARRGVLVLIPDYRKSPEHPFPAFMEDAATAVAWARHHAAGLGGNPSRIYLVGHSAGAHIAGLLATDAHYLENVAMKPHDIAGVIGLAGPYDFVPISDPKIREVFGSERQWPISQPVNFVDGDEPPFLLLHGRDDTRVRPTNSERLALELSAVNVPVTLHIIAGIGHVRLINGFVSARFSPVLEECLRWIEANEPRRP